jgi:hypothetical protein
MTNRLTQDEVKYLILTHIRDLDASRDRIGSDLDKIEASCKRVIHWTEYLRTLPEFTPSPQALVLDPNWVDDLGT